MRLLERIPHLGEDQRKRAREEIAALSQPRLSFYGMVALSAVIASYGLLANSTAVVIGAMLVAPLMGPIFGISLALGRGDRFLLLRSTLAEGWGVLLVTGIAFGIGLMPLRADFGPEITARIQPTLYDIFIALAAGLAGAYALVNERISPSLPGVAVAVAVVPPLATCGLCLAAGYWSWALGAFLLFLANFLAIQLAAAVIFTVFGLLRRDPADNHSLMPLVGSFGISLLALAVLAVFFTYTLVRLVQERQFSQHLDYLLSREIRSTLGAQLTQTDYQRRGEAVQVVATVFTPLEFDSRQVGRLEQVLHGELDPHIRLVVRSLLSKDYDYNGRVFLPEEQGAQTAEQLAEAELISRASALLREKIRRLPGASLTELRREEEEGVKLLTAVVRTPTAVEPAQVAQTEQELQRVLGEPIRLVVTSLITRDADAQRFLYEPELAPPRPLSGEELQFHRRLEQALQRQLAGQLPGATLAEFRYGREGELLPVLAVARTPRALEAQQVEAIETALREHVDPAIRLIVRSQVGADVSARGYVDAAQVEGLLAVPRATMP